MRRGGHRDKECGNPGGVGSVAILGMPEEDQVCHEDQGKGTPVKVVCAKFKGNAISDLLRAQYVKAHKGVTMEIDELWRGSNHGKTMVLE
jgi:hypothetical protein